MIRWFAFSLFACLLLAATILEAAEADRAGQAFFEKKIRPVLVEHCYKCHSASSKEVEGQLLLDTRDGIRRGGESGPAVVPGKPKPSLLLSALRHEEFEMPPKEKLPDAVIADFAKWIKMGAPDPREGAAAPIQQNIDVEAGRQFWAFQPIQDATAPQVKNQGWIRSDVDRFVLAALESQKLKPVADADPRTLVRRLYFDLIGLPPSAEQVQSFVADPSPEALARLVDALLASPQFGERWGRHWLDIARYAESNGNVRNQTFQHAWRYRDYVIKAMNADTPYDQFITQQIAGDLLEASSTEERNDNLTATGFLALGSKPVLKGKKQNGYVADIADDQIEVTTRSIMALTVACARCHDHKFDPIPTTDYYAMAGLFASSNTLYGGTQGKAMGAFAATGLHVLESDDPQQAKAYLAWKGQVEELDQERAALAKELKKVGRKKGKGKRKRPNKKRAKKKLAEKESKKPSDNEKEESPAQDPQQARAAEIQSRLKEIGVELKKLRSNAVAQPDQAMGIRDAAKVTEVPVHVRGVKATGSPISRGFVSVASSGSPIKIPQQGSGRLELAQWLTSDKHPLTSRVAVNRIWQHLLGEGLVTTEDNFGRNGKKPTHPELLDWLATRFMTEDGWSVKQMIRRIVLSRTYALGSHHESHNYQIDPDNVYLWRHARHRLEAEAIRDSILAASGQLDLTPGRGSVVTKHGGKLVQDGLTPDKIHEPSNHRSIYLALLRNGLPDVLEIFDMADPSLVVGHRNVTTVPSQELYLMNNPFVIAQAGHFAQLLLAEKDIDNAGRIEQAYWRALSRGPTDTELQRATNFLQASITGSDQESGTQADRSLSAWTSLCQALYISAEFRYVK